jgi:hypothetical protein
VFCVVSKGRPDNVPLIMDGILKGTGADIVWFVGEDDLVAYKALIDTYASTSAKGIPFSSVGVKASGGLCASRNAALDHAKGLGKYCVQV